MKLDKTYLGVLIFCAVLNSFRLAMPTTFQVDETKNPMFDAFTNELGEWKGKDSPVDEKTYEILETRNVLSRLYENSKGQQMHLLLVGSHKDRRVAHPPEVCYLSSNYIILNESEKTVPVQNTSLPVKFFLARHERHPERQELVAYLYRVGDRFTTNYYSQQLQFAVDRLAQKNSEVLLIRIAIPTAEEKLSPELEKSFEDFFAQLLAYLAGGQAQ